MVDIKPIYLNKRYLFQNKIYFLDKIIVIPENTGDNFKENIAFPEGISSLLVILC